MITTPLASDYSVQHSIRPIKYAYFFKEDDKDALRHIVGFLCTQWGGIRSILVPVKADMSIPSWLQNVLCFHEPDQFIDYASRGDAHDNEDHNRLQAQLRSFWPKREINLQKGGKYFEQFDPTAHPLSMISDRDLQTNRLTVHRFRGRQPERLALEAAFGSIYPGQEKAYAESIGSDTTDLGIHSDGFWLMQYALGAFSSVLNLTGYKVKPRQVTGGDLGSNHFDVVVVSTVEDLCYYWNLRATRESTQIDQSMGRRTLLLPGVLVRDLKAMQAMVDFIRIHMPHPAVSTNLHIRFHVAGRRSRDKLLDAMQSVVGVAWFTEEKVTAQMRWSRDSTAEPEDFTNKPLTYYVTAFPLPVAYSEGMAEQIARRVQLVYGNNKLLLTPSSDYRNRYGGSVALDIESDVWQRYPKDQAVANAIKQGCYFSRYGLTFIGNVSDRPQYFDINLPSEWETLQLYFSAHGYSIQESKPAAYGTSVVELVGGMENVDVFASPLSYGLLDTLAVKSTKKLAQRIVGQLADRGIRVTEAQVADIQPLLDDLQVVPELKRIPKTYKQLLQGLQQSDRKRLLGILGRLSEHGVVRRGFYLTCVNCGTPSWYPLGTMQERVACPGCSTQFPLPVEYPKTQEIQWEYTLNTLVNRAMDQDVLPAILAIRRLTKGKQACCIVPGLELRQEGNDPTAELDFVLILDGNIHAGECKAGKGLEQKDIRTARLASGLGVHKFYFCTLKEPDADSRKLIDALRTEQQSGESQMQVEVLTGIDLLGQR